LKLDDIAFGICSINEFDMTFPLDVSVGDLANATAASRDDPRECRLHIVN
jgi:hypothetical protein